MPRRPLSLLLVSCALLALWPGLVWLAVGSPADGGGFDTPMWLAFSIPTGLAAAAVVLVVHGLRLNAKLRDETTAELESLTERQAAVAVASTAGAPALAAAPADPDSSASGDATVAAEPRTARTARTARGEHPQPSKGGRAKRRAGAIARRKIRRTFRF